MKYSEIYKSDYFGIDLSSTVTDCSVPVLITDHSIVALTWEEYNEMVKEGAINEIKQQPYFL